MEMDEGLPRILCCGKWVMLGVGVGKRGRFRLNFAG